MLERRTAENGVVYYASPLLERLGVPHGFSTRLGGVSPAPFDFLNLGNPAGCATPDPSANVRENQRRFAEAIGAAGRRLMSARQVHGAHMLVVMEGSMILPDAQADALVCADHGAMVSVRVADCVPILLASEDGAVVAAVHAGWRGVIANIIPAAVAAVREASPDGALLSAIGPCIGRDAFEVGPEVLEAFSRRFPDDPPLRRDKSGPKGRVDLIAAVRRQLIESGLAIDQIDVTDRCTHCDQTEFFSHRRDGPMTGRMAAMIGPAGASQIAGAA